MILFNTFMLVIAGILFIYLIIRLLRRYYVPPEKAAGNAGEKYAAGLIRSVLNKDDLLFTNVAVTYEDKRTELDNVVVNSNGVFIIEVKTYSGTLYGSEEDSNWTKIHVSKGGNTYEKSVRNPIPQVRRQIYILSGYLRDHGIKAWVEGYAVIIGSKAPADSSYILSGTAEIGRAIHNPGKQPLSKSAIDAIGKLLG